METRADDKNRLLSKLAFFKGLQRHGWSIEKSMDMYRFLDTILTLNSTFELQYLETAKQIDEELGMKLMSTVERHGFEQGMQQGIKQGVQKGEAQILMSLLKTKFQMLPESYVQKIGTADPKTLNQWAINFVNAQSLEEVFKKPQ